MKKSCWICVLWAIVPLTAVWAQDPTIPPNAVSPGSGHLTITDDNSDPFVSDAPPPVPSPEVTGDPVDEIVPDGMVPGYSGCRGIQTDCLWLRIKSFMQWSHWGYSDRFQKVPFGSSLAAMNRAQVWNGAVARLMLYHYDFCEDPDTGEPRLNDRGYRRLQELAVLRRLPPGMPLVIERTPGNPLLDQARRDLVANLLQQSGVPTPVIIGEPMTPGVAGPEALRIHAQLMSGAGDGTVRGTSATAGQ